MSENSNAAGDQAAAFQKLWMESLSKMMHTAFQFGPDSMPPEVMREIRSGFFQAMAKSWEEFQRSPQFLEGMKQWMDSAVGLRKLTNDLLAKTRNDLQAPSREDIDTIMLNVRHMESRILDRIEELAAQVSELRNGAAPKASRPASRSSARREKKPSRQAKKRRA
jgi:hypothetical protein